MMLQTMCSAILKRFLAPSTTIRNVANLQKIFYTVSVKEIQIPTEWGHVAGKLWGNGCQRPLLALHGWQDNAGTWDTLAPILARGCSVLAVDFPGHGLSSWLPPGMQYHDWYFMYLILYIKEYFNWNKMTLLSHSMGAIASMRFACLFPNDVDAYIAFDNIVAECPYISDPHPKYEVKIMPVLLKKFMVEQSRLNSEPPSYVYEDLKKVWCMGTNHSVDMESVHHLLKRGSRQSKTDPNKYVLSRDSRLKHVLFTQDFPDFLREMSRRLTCPTLYFKGENSKNGVTPLAVEIREQLKTTNDKFEMHFVPGTHHLHLNTPELVAPTIIDFLRKYDLFDEVAMEQRNKI